MHLLPTNVVTDDAPPTVLPTNVVTDDALPTVLPTNAVTDDAPPAMISPNNNNENIAPLPPKSPFLPHKLVLETSDNDLADYFCDDSEDEIDDMMLDG